MWNPKFVSCHFRKLEQIWIWNPSQFWISLFQNLRYLILRYLAASGIEFPSSLYSFRLGTNHQTARTSFTFLITASPSAVACLVITSCPTSLKLDLIEYSGNPYAVRVVSFPSLPINASPFKASYTSINIVLTPARCKKCLQRIVRFYFTLSFWRLHPLLESTAGFPYQSLFSRTCNISFILLSCARKGLGNAFLIWPLFVRTAMQLKHSGFQNLLIIYHVTSKWLFKMKSSGLQWASTVFLSIVKSFYTLRHLHHLFRTDLIFIMTPKQFT